MRLSFSSKHSTLHFSKDSIPTRHKERKKSLHHTAVHLHRLGFSEISWRNPASTWSPAARASTEKDAIKTELGTAPSPACAWTKASNFLSRAVLLHPFISLFSSPSIHSSTIRPSGAGAYAAIRQVNARAQPRHGEAARTREHELNDTPALTRYRDTFGLIWTYMQI